MSQPVGPMDAPLGDVVATMEKHELEFQYSANASSRKQYCHRSPCSADATTDGRWRARVIRLFVGSTYEQAANLAKWDRPALERLAIAK